MNLLDQFSQMLFAIVGLVMRLAPIGAFGAMAFTVGRYGIGSLLSLGQLMAGVYITCLLFIIIVLGGILRIVGLSLIKFLRYIGEEILIVLGTSSSESALPRLMAKMERLGCSKPVVGLVVPAGYSFNLDGTAIYMTMAAVFMAQASGIELTVWQQLSILAILMVTSNGAAGVTGSGFITLAATMSADPRRFRRARWRSSWASTGSCRKPARSPTSLATPLRPWRSRGGTARWTSIRARRVLDDPPGNPSRLVPSRLFACGSGGG